MTNFGINIQIEAQKSVDSLLKSLEGGVLLSGSQIMEDLERLEKVRKDIAKLGLDSVMVRIYKLAE
jgi:hypothetical protein